MSNAMLNNISESFSLIQNPATSMIEQINNHGEMIALIIRSSFQKDGLEFFTPNNFSQQLAYMHHPTGKIIQAHVHNQVARSVMTTLEVLVIKRGRLRVDLYDHEKKYLESRTLHAGDIILLAAGGHGFEVLEEVEMFEIKQGPYAGDQDKTRFNGIEAKNIVLK
jgi:mannose-6-phosphate isomerase-like protein (cupin superfamily)